FDDIFDYNNVKYKVVIQNRVNPVELQKHHNDIYWVTPTGEDIRPLKIFQQKKLPYDVNFM
ncbi:11478_t:CDS:1, partial [Rhizophagus irregularis]